MTKKALTNLRVALEPFVGCDISVAADVGRKRVMPYEGKLESIHPNLFVLRVAVEGEEDRRLSFSYVDLFTGNVALSLIKNGRTYQFMDGK